MGIVINLANVIGFLAADILGISSPKIKMQKVRQIISMVRAMAREKPELWE